MVNVELNRGQLISVRNASELLNVSVITIKRWLKSGKLHGSKVGGTRWKVFLESCQKLVERGCN